MELAFTDGFNQSASLPSMNRQCTNWYPKFIEDGEENGRPIIRKRLVGIPGLNQLATTGEGVASEKNRGALVMDGVPYFVNGVTLNSLDAAFAITSLGTVTGSGKVSIAKNGIQLMVVVPGVAGYIFNKDTAAFEQINDPDFTANGFPQLVIFIEGYFLCITDTKKFIISSLNDGTQWNALDFGTAEADPDAIVAPVNFKSEAFIIGTKTIEGFENIGGVDFPFVKTGFIIDKGCFARFSVVVTSDTFMFIGGGDNEDPAVWSIVGNKPVSVSNTGVELLLGALSQVELDEVSGYTYKQDKSTFVAWELPLATIVYGLETGKWHIRESQFTDLAKNIHTVGWRATALVTAYSKLICFDAIDGRVGEVSLTIFDEYSAVIRRFFDVNPLRAGKNSFVIPRIEVTPEAGVADSSTPNPKIRMKVSRDGQTFAGERIRSLGLVGKTGHRPVWRQNGRFKQYGLFRFLMASDVKPVIISVDAEITIGRT